MTREQAKIELMSIYGALSSDKQIAIDTLLEQEPCDTISRDAVKNEIKCWIGSGEHRYAMAEKFLFDRINDLPGVSSRKGHWVIERDPNTGKDMSYHCSNCYEDSGFYTTSASKFCPNCGMLMNLQPIEENEVTE